MTSFKPRRFRHATERVAKRYSSDLSDREWKVVQPLLPAAKTGRGRRGKGGGGEAL